MKLTWLYNDGQLPPLPLAARKSSADWSNRWLMNKKLVRWLICAVVFLLVLGVYRLDYAWARSVQAGIAYALSEDYDLTPWLTRLSEVMLWETNGGRPVFSPQVKTKPAILSQPMVYPVAAGKISREYGWYMSNDNQQRFHEGIDIDASLGKPIQAVLPGEVVRVGEDRNLGRLVQLDHGEKVLTLYGHCQEILVKPGDKVDQGDIIAKVGQTGTDHPQVYFEIRVDGQLVDPLAQIRGSGK